MKRLFSFVLALALVLSLSVTAFAATGTGSITITNATVGQTYELYKFFDATYAADALGNPILDANGNPTIAYTIEKTDKFFTAMFGSTGTTPNPYFDYNVSTGVVTKKGTASDADVITYLSGLAKDPAYTCDASIPASSETVVFSGLDTGYYLVHRGVGSAVTLTTNTPNASIIDKNQIPGTDFSKVMMEGGTGVEINSASIGEEIEFKLSFTATNYDGDKQIEYYTIHDVKSSSLWAEFNTVAVSVGGVPLTKGYYFFGGTVGNPAKTGEWEYLGTGWGTIDPLNKPDPSQAQWYLIHKTYDEFEIVIPWLKNHTFTGNEPYNTYVLTFDEPLESRYDSTEPVEVIYKAAVGPDAVSGPIENTATLTWEDTGLPGGGTSDKTETKVYNLGITKVAKSDQSPLAGATFELYADEACTKPIWVVPTGDEGVYIVDDVDTVVSGYKRETVRQRYAGPALNAWLAADPKPENTADPSKNKRNDMTTPADGQLIVLGLEADLVNGTYYYVKETAAPAGYNQLDLPVAIKVGGVTNSSTVYDGITVYDAVIENNNGVELPATGGQGTMMMITIGTMMAIAFAVLLITHKKMSVYHD